MVSKAGHSARQISPGRDGGRRYIRKQKKQDDYRRQKTARCPPWNSTCYDLLRPTIQANNQRA